jgi:hypothetical protein
VRAGRPLENLAARDLSRKNAHGQEQKNHAAEQSGKWILTKNLGDGGICRCWKLEAGNTTQLSRRLGARLLRTSGGRKNLKSRERQLWDLGGENFTTECGNWQPDSRTQNTRNGVYSSGERAKPDLTGRTGNTRNNENWETESGNENTDSRAKKRSAAQAPGGTKEKSGPTDKEISQILRNNELTYMRCKNQFFYCNSIKISTKIQRSPLSFPHLIIKSKNLVYDTLSNIEMQMTITEVARSPNPLRSYL